MRKHFTSRARALAPALLLLMWLGACAQPEEDAPAKLEFGHVHGLGVNPADDRLYVATHDGLYVIDGSTPRKVGHGTDDLMGFTISGPDEFLASGHPSTTDRPNPLGLVRSDDFGVTWEPVALAGQADLHVIETASQRIVAYDSMTQTIVTSNDGKTYTQLAQLEVTDLAVTPEGDVLTAEPDGSVRFVRDDGPEKIETAPPLVLIDGAETLVGIGPEGQIWTSQDGRAWSGLGTLQGQPQALDATGDRWFAATTSGLYASSDQGRSWKSLL